MANIVFLTRLYKPHVGGVQKHVEEISKRLVNKDHNVTVITTKEKKDLATTEVVDGVSVIRLGRPNIKYLGLLITWLNLLKYRKIFSKADVVHCHDVFIWYLPFKLLFSKNVYTTFHGWEGEYPIPKKNIYFKKMAARLSKKNICVGKYIEKHFHIKADKITYGATDLPKTKISKKEKKLVYVGRLDEDTSLGLILKAFQKLDGYTVEFCGDGILADECSEYGKVHGFVDPKKHIKDAKIVFVGGYLSTLEAFSYKCAAIAAYDNKLRKDYFKMNPFYKWVFISDDPKKIAEKIADLSKSKEVYNNLTKKAHNWVKTQTWDKLTREYLQLWQLIK